MAPAWASGVFALWCGGERLGSDDHDTPLHGCRNWAADLAARLPEHVSPEHFTADVAALAPMLLHHGDARHEPRFDLSYLGMDSIIDRDHAVALVISDAGAERLLWRRGSSPPGDRTFTEGTVLGVVRDWVQAFDQAVLGAGGADPGSHESA